MVAVNETAETDQSHSKSRNLKSKNENKSLYHKTIPRTAAKDNWKPILLINPGSQIVNKKADKQTEFKGLPFLPIISPKITKDNIKLALITEGDRPEIIE